MTLQPRSLTAASATPGCRGAAGCYTDRFDKLPGLHTIMSFSGPLIDTDWLQEHLHDPDLRILDCSVSMQVTDNEYHFISGRDEYDRGHIPGSVFVDVLNELCDQGHVLPLMMPPLDQIAQVMAVRGVANGTRVVLYDRSNHAWAARVWWLLRVCGFEDAAVLNGGWLKWRQEDRPALETTALLLSGMEAGKNTDTDKPDSNPDLRNSIEAPCKSAICLTIASPSPQPMIVESC